MIEKIKVTLRNDSYTKGMFDDGRIKYFFSEAAVDEVFTRLLARLTQFESSSAGFQITAKYAAHFRRVYLEGHSSFTACRIELLLVALPFVLRDLLAPELAHLEQAIRNRLVKTVNGDTPPRPEDPCPDMIKALACFIDWYMLARKLWFPVDMAPELQRRATVMKRELKRVFPENLKNWKFPKFHSPAHKAAEILMGASTPFTETAMFESGHKPIIKDVSGNSNNHNQFQIISRFHNRVSALSQLGQAASRHARYVLKGSDSDSSSDASEDEEDDLFTDPLTSRPSEMAARMPLWDMIFATEAGGLRREPFSIGAKGRGRQRLVSAACMAGAPAALQRQASNRISARFAYNHATDFPALRYLPAQLCHFVHEYLGGILGLGDVPESQRDIHGVLDTYLVRDPDGTDIHTFGGLAIRCQHHKGTVRVRSRPFAGDQFRGRNPQVCSALSKQSCVFFL